MSPQPTILEILAIYNADGGIVGELRYVASKAFTRTSCGLCDITHSWRGRRTDYDQACSATGLTPTLLHRNEAPPDALEVAGPLPAVVVRLDDGTYRRLLTAEDLQNCEAQPQRFVTMLQTRINEQQ